MHRVFSSACFALLVAFCFAPATVRAEGGPVVAYGEVSFERYAALYPVIGKMRYLQQFLCTNIYPAPATPRACLDSMLVVVDREFPLAKMYDKPITYPAFLDKTTLRTHITPEVIVLAKRLMGACGYVEDLPACTEKFFVGMYSAFDHHTRYLPPARVSEEATGRYAGLGIPFEKRADGTIVVSEDPDEGTPAGQHGIRSGDEIVAVDGVDARSFKDLYAVRNALRGVHDTMVRLSLRRTGATEVVPLEIRRAMIVAPLVRSRVVTDDTKRYGIVRISEFGKGMVREFRAHVDKLFAPQGGHVDGLIIRLESNPGGRMDEARNLLRYLVGERVLIVVRDAKGVRPYVPTQQPEDEARDTANVLPPGIPVLVVVDGFTASAAEAVAGAVQHYGVGMVAGPEVTYGKGVQQVVDGHLEEADKSSVRVTNSEFAVGEIEDFKSIQCVGVTPDLAFVWPGRVRDRATLLRECDIPGSVRPLAPQASTRTRSISPELRVASEAMLATFLRLLQGDTQR